MGRGKVVLRYPAPASPPVARRCPTGKERFATDRAAQCALRHFEIFRAADVEYAIKKCGQCGDGRHVERIRP